MHLGRDVRIVEAVMEQPQEVRKQVFEFVDYQAIPVDTQALKRNRPSADVAAKTLKLLTLMGFAGDGGVQ